MSKSVASLRVLAIPELLDLVLNFGDEELQRRCALVCRSWSDVALNAFWREVDFPKFLILCKILSPIELLVGSIFRELESPTEWAFETAPTAADWARFAPYGRRVRSFVYSPRPIDQPVSKALFDDLARTRTSHRIFPNLRALSWLSTSRFHSEEIFMHEGIRELRIRLDGRWDEAQLPDFSASVAERTPLLTSITLEPIFKHSNFQPLAELFPLLKCLTSVSLPVNILTSDMLRSLGTLPELKTLGFIAPTDVYRPHTHYPSSPINYSPPVEGSFLALKDLSLFSSLQEMKGFLIDGARISNIEELYLVCPFIESPEEVEQFFAALADRYPTLEELNVDIIVSAKHAEEVGCEPLTFKTLRPLLTISTLKTLDIRHNLPLTLSPDELVEMGASYPNMVELGLSCDALTMKRPPTTLEILPVIAEHFPQLEVLRIFLDACTPPSRESLQRKGRFEHLKILEFGSSPIGEVKPVQMFLSRLLAEGIRATDFSHNRFTLMSGVTWDVELFDESPVLVSAMRTSFSRWEEVAQSLALLIQLRLDEMRRRNELMKEVEDLRMRSDVLATRAQVRGAAAAENGRPCVIM